jgi:excinuclease ABC subunit C
MVLKVKVAGITPELELQLSSLPDAPGVYFFKDAQGETVYIGKAAKLKTRVRSYWNGNTWLERPKLAVMMPKVHSLNTIITNSEKEALLLEATLIRKHMPRFNVSLKDDRRYPWLAITYDEPFPRLVMIRDPIKFRQTHKRARVFGPYVEAGAMWETVRVLRKVFPLRQRAKPLFKDRPCMNYYIGLCLGPCQKLVAEPEYDHLVKQVEMFLAGRQSEVLRELERDMLQASREMRFEDAAKSRDRIAILKGVIERQQVFFESQKVNQDIVAQAGNNRSVSIALLRIREGKLISSESMILPLHDKTTVLEAYSSFVDQYYTTCDDINLPREILLAHEVEDMEVLSDYLSSRLQTKVKLVVPQKGEKLRLIEMAGKNAQHTLDQEAAQYERKQEENADLLLLKAELDLKNIPHRIECFDISNIQGTDNVASMVVLEEGLAKKSDYRQYKVKSIEGKANDFASMKEVVYRRYLRLQNENKPLPDLIIIDGGKGQLAAAVEALSQLETDTISGDDTTSAADDTSISAVEPDNAIKSPLNLVDIIGLAKQQEEVYKPGGSRPYLLPRNSPALHILQRARDEAHRFALTFHRKLRAKRSIVSNFDKLPSVGKARRKALLDFFGSYSKLEEASLDEIKSVPGLPRPLAEKIWQALHGDNDA